MYKKQAKTLELDGALLDWAVAMADNRIVSWAFSDQPRVGVGLDDIEYSPTTNDAQLQPILSKMERIGLQVDDDVEDTLLRYVQYMLGDEIGVPA